MARETLEELRDRLLSQHNVRQMIQVRAYEIFRMRGGQPGGDAQDWFQAEGEVLAFLIAHESAQEDDLAEAEPAAVSAFEAPTEPPRAKTPKARAATKTSKDKQAKKAATKRAAPRKSPTSKSKSKRTTKPSKTDGQRSEG